MVKIQSDYTEAAIPPREIKWKIKLAEFPPCQDALRSILMQRLGYSFVLPSQGILFKGQSNYHCSKEGKISLVGTGIK